MKRECRLKASSVSATVADILKRLIRLMMCRSFADDRKKPRLYSYSATMGEQKDNATRWFSFLSCCFLSTELKNKSALSENQWNARGAQYALDRMPAQRAKSTCAFDTVEMEREYQRKAPFCILIFPFYAYKMNRNNRNLQ